MKQDSITFNEGKVLNIYIVYEISKSINISDYLILENCLLGVVSLTKNSNYNKYKYSEYGIGFDKHGRFSFPGTGLRQNVIVFGVDMSSSTKIDNRKKNILILGKRIRTYKELKKMLVATILIILMRNCVFLMLLKIWILKYLI